MRNTYTYCYYAVRAVFANISLQYAFDTPELKIFAGVREYRTGMYNGL